MNEFILQSSAVIFDVDGLLIDSEPLWYQARSQFLARFGKKTTPEIERNVIGRGMKEVIELFQHHVQIAGEMSTLIQQYRDDFYSIALTPGKLHLMDGAAEFIQTLYKQKLLAVATGGHTKEKITEILTLLNIESYFSVLVSSDQVARGKPSPDVYLFTAKKLKTEPSHCVVVEDAVNGVEAAKAAGMKVIAINKNIITQSFLTEAGADVVVSSFHELP